MDEYAKGVFECLSWLEARINDLDKNDENWILLQDEVSSTILDIRRGVGEDFRSRLRARF